MEILSAKQEKMLVRGVKDEATRLMILVWAQAVMVEFEKLIDIVKGREVVIAVALGERGPVIETMHSEHAKTLGYKPAAYALPRSVEEIMQEISNHQANESASPEGGSEQGAVIADGRLLTPAATNEETDG